MNPLLRILSDIVFGLIWADIGLFGFFGAMIRLNTVCGLTIGNEFTGPLLGWLIGVPAGLALGVFLSEKFMFKGNKKSRWCLVAVTIAALLLVSRVLL
ncbi:MAG: hypothetical protein EHM48_03410 [Planctomycetaceae bacterium]|nr:MAG: hypothetical protein EHM48_03410 [Planctomycetaceae bacterium]